MELVIGLWEQGLTVGEFGDAGESIQIPTILMLFQPKSTLGFQILPSPDTQGLPFVSLHYAIFVEEIVWQYYDYLLLFVFWVRCEAGEAAVSFHF